MSSLWITLLLASIPAGVPPAVEIAPAVFVRDVASYGIAGSNQVFIVFDTFVVVFDPGSVSEARNLAAQIRARTDKPVRYVINSHFHPDHSAGAAVFAQLGAEVVAAEAARGAFGEWVRHDFAEKARSRPEEFRGLIYVPPSRWVDGKWAIDDGTRRLEVMHLGHGHTSGDLVGWMPRERILLAQDLSTNGQHNLANADVSGWIGILEHLRALDPLVVVPGHKRLAGPELLEKSSRYLTELRTQARRMVASGLTYEQALQSIDIPMYEEWSGVPVRSERMNVLRAFQQAGGTIAQPASFITIRRLEYAIGLAVLCFVTVAVLRQWLSSQPVSVPAHIPDVTAFDGVRRRPEKRALIPIPARTGEVNP